MTSRLAADPALLLALRARWEALLPELPTQSWPKAWGETLRGLSDCFNRLDGAPKGDYFAATNLAPYFAHHGWAQAESLAAVAAETPEAFLGATEVWDLGAGPGPLSLAASLLAPAARYTLTDLRSEALAFAGGALQKLGVEARTERVRLPDLPAGQPDLVLLGHTLNELEPKDQERLLARLKERLAPQGALVILEPALPAPTRRLMELREPFLAAPWSLAAPCPCPGPCPMLALPKQWCVAELPWAPPPWFTALDQAAGLERRHLAFAYLVARRDAPPKAPAARIVGVPKPQKGKIERWVCTPSGGERWEALSRHGEPEWALPRTAELPLPLQGEGLKELEGGWKLRRWHP
ncbi:MAG: methyltransferase domain-containing protein [Holophagaceae bacterium]|nr:methyltransferase domain-containing protein [Holophagaceae bacterium]